MDKNSVVTILGTPHRLREAVKQSPDGRLHECIYGREIVKEIAVKLQAMGYHVMIDFEPLDLPRNMQSQSPKVERQRELALRVNFVNEVCRQEGAKNVVYVSIHVDASGDDGKWHDPNGWSVRVSTNASIQSKRLANCLFDAAKAHGLRMRQPMAQQKFWPQNLYVLNNTQCPAVLTENLFQDNLDDVDFLLSDEGRHVIERLHIEGIIKYIESL
ncbi:N-acetylmuramoyl-L-alanine amidase [Prevotella sp. E9-3]|uniref:N-acetylmuramoyl-L-alanine amidase n=1 Tax=Prevotella sp. E9-3 TaxID=2913621 RepID=UPI001EDBF8C9|nr:N-acetylmuramoyl-L-alanine amidase [Prevotella sp. E9-3]UKK48784.1 N-acetylmuramoyl-L-alanine amidase [Prevotella sp. E9-3]